MHKINSRLSPMGVSNKFFVASCFWVIQHFDSFSGITSDILQFCRITSQGLYTASAY
jgi:hypothetical protein